MNRWAQAANRISSVTDMHMARTVNEHVPQELFKATTDAILRARNNEGAPISPEDAVYIAGAKRVLKFMYDCWLNNKLCDTILNVAEGHQLHAHKLVLCAYSKALVQECNQFPKGNVVSLDLKEFSKDIVLELLYFVYTTKITIHDGNLRGLVHLSIELDVDVLMNLCQSHLKTYDSDNALSYYDIAQEIGMTGVMDHIQAYVCRNFTDVVVGSEFLTISVERLNSILADDRVTVITELEIFHAVVRWIDYENDVRLSLAPALMRHVRFAMINPEILVTKVEVHTQIFDMRECQNMLYEAMKYHALKLSGSAMAGHYAPLQTRDYRFPSSAYGAENYTNHTDASNELQYTENLVQQLARPATPVRLTMPPPTLPQTITVVPRPPSISPPRAALPRELFSEPRRDDIYRPPISPRPMIMSRHQDLASRATPVQSEAIVPNQRSGNIPMEGILPNYFSSSHVSTPHQAPSQLQRAAPVASEAIVPRPRSSHMPMEGILPNYISSSHVSTPQHGASQHQRATPVPSQGRVVNQRSSRLPMEGILPNYISSSHVSSPHQGQHQVDTIGGIPTPPRSPSTMAPTMYTALDDHPSLDSLITPHHMFKNLTAVAIGGIDISSTDMDFPGRCLYKYDEQQNNWSLLTMMNQYTHHHTAAVIDNKIYIIGGIVPDSVKTDELAQATDHVKMFDGEHETWVHIAPMLQCRSYITAAVHNGCIYVAGGENENKMKLSTIEKYDSNFDKWTILANMQGGAKIGTANCVYKNCLYIVGGYNMGPVLSDVECFDLENKCWLPKSPLRVPRCHANLVVANNKMYLVGGRTQSADGMTSMSSLAVYDDASDQWLHVADMVTPRLDCGCTAVGSKLFIIGGMHTPNPECLSLVEVYDTVSEKWLHHVTNLPQPSAGLACVTVV